MAAVGPNVDGVYLDEDGRLTIQLQGRFTYFDLTTTEMRKLAEELAATAIRRDLRGAR